MKPMSVSEIARLTGRSVHMVRSTATMLKLQPVYTEPIGRFPRQFFLPDAIIERLNQVKPSRQNGPYPRRN